MLAVLSIEDVWKNSYSENTSRKVWAAKYTARHPNLIALELNSFRCGHDAPIFSVIEEIVEASGTPFFAFRDLDENKPAGSIRIRIETVHHFLKRYREVVASEADLLQRVAGAWARERSGDWLQSSVSTQWKRLTPRSARCSSTKS